MARRVGAAAQAAAMAADQASERRPHLWRGIFAFLALVTAAMLALFLFAQLEHFLITDARFVLEGPPEAGSASRSFRMEGLNYTPESQVVEIFARDYGHSLYLCPIAERRRRLLAIDWVKDAAVVRIWPNQIVVKITERKPVAFLPITGEGGSVARVALIDDEGVLLNPRRMTKLNLPVLTGVRASDTEEARKTRVKKLLRFKQDAGELMDRISEVDVTDTDNLRVTTAVDNRAVTLLLGNHKFRQRLENFFEHFPEIRRRLPRARTVDLRLDDRITVVGEDSAGSGEGDQERRDGE